MIAAQEAYHVAEALGVARIAVSPCLIPYTVPSHFEGWFKKALPSMYAELQTASMSPPSPAGATAATGGGDGARTQRRRCNMPASYAEVDVRVDGAHSQHTAFHLPLAYPPVVYILRDFVNNISTGCGLCFKPGAGAAGASKRWACHVCRSL